MKKKNLLALALAGALSLGLLAGCGNTAKEPEKEPITAEQVDLSVLTGPVEFVSGLTPETVVAKAGKYDVTADVLLYWFNYAATYTLQQAQYAGQAEMDWSADAGDGRSVADAVMDTALELAAYYVVMPGVAQEEYEVKVDEELQAQVQAQLDMAVEQFGSQEKAEHYLWMAMGDSEMHRKMSNVAALEDGLREKLFGEGGQQEPTDAEILAYAADELGYYGAKHILLCTVDMTKPVYGEDGALTGFESLPEDQVAAQKKLTEELDKQLKEAADPVELFDELMHEYSEDTGLATNPNGYTAYKGQMVPEFEQTALGLKEGEISGAVESLYGYHIIMRIPLDPDDYREYYVAGALEKMASGWMEEYPVQSNDTYDKLDTVDCVQRMFAMQEALYLELNPPQEEAPETESETPAE